MRAIISLILKPGKRCDTLQQSYICRPCGCYVALVTLNLEYIGIPFPKREREGDKSIMNIYIKLKDSYLLHLATPQIT